MCRMVGSWLSVNAICPFLNLGSSFGCLYCRRKATPAVAVLLIVFGNYQVPRWRLLVFLYYIQASWPTSRAITAAAPQLKTGDLAIYVISKGTNIKVHGSLLPDKAAGKSSLA